MLRQAVSLIVKDDAESHQRSPADQLFYFLTGQHPAMLQAAGQAVQASADKMQAWTLDDCAC